MPNDMIAFDEDLKVCFALKIGYDTPIIQLAVRFFHHLIELSTKTNFKAPVIIFAHSMGAIIAEHALELLKPTEREQLRIFTFGGGSFISPDKCHPDSHNFASANDFVCLFGSPYFRTLAIRQYVGYKEGLSQEQLIHNLAYEEALFYLDTVDNTTIQNYVNQRKISLKKELDKIRNITILDPKRKCEHSFCNEPYQKILHELINKYKKKEIQEAFTNTP